MNNETILKYLSETEYISGQRLADILGVSRQTVWKAVNALRNSGYIIETVPHKGYRIKEYPRRLCAAAVKSLLKTQVIGKNFIELDEVGSTNDLLKRLGSEGCPNGTVAAAHSQTNGKGRLGRVWESERDRGLAFSILLRPKLMPAQTSAVTPLTGLAVCKALRSFTGIDCKIKWPNDVIAGNRKVAGILTEMSAEFDAVEYIVTGIGVNAEQTVFPEEIAFKATSLLLESGRLCDQNRLISCILEHIEKTLMQSGMELSQPLLKEYTDLCVTVGRNVSFVRGARRMSGMAVGVSESGELKVMLSDGSIININSGEVTVQGIY